jgi:hypothetical protein
LITQLLLYCKRLRRHSPMARRRLSVVIWCVVIGVVLISAHLTINQVTVSGKPRALWRTSLSGFDIGVDTWPAEPDYGGYVEVWYESHDVEDYQPFLRLPGTPALPVLPTPRPGESPLDIPRQRATRDDTTARESAQPRFSTALPILFTLLATTAVARLTGAQSATLHCTPAT